MLQIADFLGEGWPEILREALAAIFQEAVDFDLKESLQLLADVRDCFAHHGYVERLSTSDLLAWLHSRSARPWDVDGPITARRLAQLLSPFDILPRVQRIGKKKLARGYQLQDFVEHWQKHLNFEVPGGSQDVGGSHGLQSVVTHSADSQILNKDEGCYAVTDSRTDSKIPADQRESILAGRALAHDNHTVVATVLGTVSVGSSQSEEPTEYQPTTLVVGESAQADELVSEPASEPAVTHAGDSEIANKDAYCYAVTDSRALSETCPGRPWIGGC